MACVILSMMPVSVRVPTATANAAVEKARTPPVIAAATVVSATAIHPNILMTLEVFFAFLNFSAASAMFRPIFSFSCFLQFTPVPEAGMAHREDTECPTISRFFGISRARRRCARNH
ncbi:MAG: hypothetical protein E5Y35_08995 [Mesorhizobium sp.]|nr:MAG: hypothetical protein E5Y35_08995 [Mesorhizobium sp.]